MRFPHAYEACGVFVEAEYHNIAVEVSPWTANGLEFGHRAVRISKLLDSVKSHVRDITEAGLRCRPMAL